MRQNFVLNKNKLVFAGNGCVGCVLARIAYFYVCHSESIGGIYYNQSYTYSKYSTVYVSGDSCPCIIDGRFTQKCI